MSYRTVLRCVLRGTVWVDGARYIALGLEMHGNDVAEVVIWADGRAQARVGQDIYPLTRA